MRKLALIAGLIGLATAAVAWHHFSERAPEARVTPVSKTPPQRAPKVYRAEATSGPVVFVRENYLWGVMSTAGKMVLAPQFDFWSSVFTPTAAYIVAKDDKYGVLSAEGKWIVPMEHDAVYPVEWSGKKYLSAIKDATGTGGLNNQPLGGKQGIYDLSGKLIIPFKHFSVTRIKGGFFAVNDSASRRDMTAPGKWGLLDSNLEVIFPAKYAAANCLNGIVDLGGKFGKTDGTILDLGDYEEVRRQSTSWHLMVKKNNKWGLVNNQGELAIPAQFDELGKESFYGMVAVNKGQKRPFDWLNYTKNGADPELDGLWGVYRTNGQLVLPVNYLQVFIAAPNLILCEAEKWGAVDTTGKVIIPFKYDQLAYCETGFIRTVEKKSIRYFQQKPGGELLEMTQQGITDIYVKGVKPFLTILKTKAGYKALTRGGKLSETFQMEGYHILFSDDSLDQGYLIHNRAGGQTYFFDKHLKVTSYEQHVPLETGYLVKKRNKWGYVHSNGVLQIATGYDTLLVGRGEYVLGKKEGQWWILKKGKAEKTRLDFKIARLGPFSDGLAPVAVGGTTDVFGGLQGEKWGYINSEGTVAIRFKFEDARSFKEGVAAVQIRNIPGSKVLNQKRWILINREGKQVGNYDFDEIQY